MFNKTTLLATTIASTMLLTACQTTAQLPAATPVWSKSASPDANLLNPQLSDRTANLIFVRPAANNQNNPDTSTNIALDDRFLVSVQDNHYSQAIVCAGNVALSAVPTSAKINDLSYGAATIKLDAGQTQVFAVTTDANNTPTLTPLYGNDINNALNGTYRQGHQISRVQAKDCPAPAVVAPAPVAPVPQPASEYYVETRPNVRLNILFDTDKSNIKPQYQSEVTKAANFLKQYPEANAIIEGHTDSRGSDAYNQALSERRAASVVQALINQHGVNPSRLSAQGFGESRPVASNDNAEGRAQNRRVMVVIPNE